MTLIRLPDGREKIVSRETARLLVSLGLAVIVRDVAIFGPYETR